MRRGTHSRWLCVARVAAGAAALFVPAPALAAEVEHVALLYETKGACPSEPDFLTIVRRYTTRWTLVPEGTAAARTIRVRVAGDPEGATGALAVERATGTMSEREIAGPDCATVAEALAIMVAVAIDPRAGTSGDENERAPEDDVGGTAAQPPPAVVPAAQARVPRPAPSKEAPQAAWGPLFAVDMRGEATSAVVRGPLFVVAVSMKLELPDAVGPQWLRTLRPSVGIGVRQSFPKEHALRGGSVEFLWSAGHLRACPFRIPLGTLAEVSPCVESNVGRLGAAAEGYAYARRTSSLWVDLGGSLWATVRVSSRVFLSSTFLVTAPLTREEFVLASGASVSGAPALGILGGMGVGVSL